MAHIYPKMERFVPRYGIYKLVMGKFKKRQRHSGQTREPPIIFYDSS